MSETCAQPQSVRALKDLQCYIESSLHWQLVEMTEQERMRFRLKHPGAHFVIGDFEIKCLNPEKYDLERT